MVATLPRPVPLAPPRAPLPPTKPVATLTPPPVTEVAALHPAPLAPAVVPVAPTHPAAPIVGSALGMARTMRVTAPEPGSGLR
jgi:hypothetical protein